MRGPDRERGDDGGLEQAGQGRGVGRCGHGSDYTHCVYMECIDPRGFPSGGAARPPRLRAADAVAESVGSGGQPSRA
ncbi:hypothetical protein Shyd_75460 [Streptomyces hydrogenans]|uniref:Uncharacterized protein n=1 Tax=Streptomyces hydrogenans TaxID=1873719 RepID=A0ABQ3PMC1_9ACTN|nr:hypothetical protein GCM10018784_05660 [Streptomyces hydrogenans]GHI26175.1 hypothetical protein Shyd_75460 [Streptomyces hydrogenans]